MLSPRIYSFIRAASVSILQRVGVTLTLRGPLASERSIDPPSIWSRPWRLQASPPRTEFTVQNRDVLANNSASISYRCLRGLCHERSERGAEELDGRVDYFERGDPLVFFLSSLLARRRAISSVLEARRDERKKPAAFSPRRLSECGTFFLFHASGCYIDVCDTRCRLLYARFDVPRRHYESAGTISSISLELSLLHARPTARDTCGAYMRYVHTPSLIAPRSRFTARRNAANYAAAEAALRAPRRFISRAARLSVSFLRSTDRGTICFDSFVI